MTDLENPLTSLTHEQRLYYAVVASLHGWGDPERAWNPHPGQALVGQALFVDGAKKIFVQCGRKWGKPLDLDTPIPTPSGFIPLRDIREGSVVFDQDGKVCQVTALSPIEYRDCYEVCFSDGSRVISTDNHRWLTHTKDVRKSQSRSRKAKKPKVVTTRRIRETLRAGKEWNHSIPCAGAIDLPSRNLPLDPYVLGVWLGDGSSASGNVTGVDEQVFDELRRLGFPSYKTKRPITRNVRGLFRELRKLGVVKNKHVPWVYLWGSKDDRLALLQGLMDTDGTIEKNGRCCFDNTNKQLIDAVAHLLSSLGQQFKRETKKTTGKLCYRIKFYPTIPVFRLERKATRVGGRRKPNHRFIVAVNPVLTRPTRCLEVSSETHQFLVGENFIPTHNTEIIVYCLWRYALLNSNVSCYYICPEAKHAREIVWESVDRRGRKRIQGFGPAEFIEHIDNQNLRITFKNGSFIKVDGSDNVDAWAGISPHFLVLDEFRSFRPEFLPVMNPNRATFDAPMIVIGTPPEQLWLDRETPHHYVELAKETREEMGEGMPSFWIHRPSWDNPDPIIQAFLKTEKATLLRKGREYEWLREYGAELVPGSARKVFPSFCPDVSKPKSHMVSELTVAKIIRGEGGYGITRS